MTKRMCYDVAMKLPNALPMIKRSIMLLAVSMLLVAQIPHSAGAAPATLAMVKPIYQDALAFGWQSWSWGSTIQLNAATPVYSGSYSISVTITEAYGALYLHDEYYLPTAGYTHLRFFIHGGTQGGQKLQVILNEDTTHSYAVTATAGQWQEVTIPLTVFGSPASMQDIYFQGAVNSTLPTFYVDDIFLINPDANYKPRVWAPLILTPGFVTLPPGAALPSDAACAAQVRKMPENKGDNRTFNATKGSQTLPADFFGSAVDPRANTVIAKRVTGNFTGTTDEILQWAACKWGIDENMVRAQAVVESWWRQGTLGDWTTDQTRCAPGRGLGVDGRPGECPESFGILQTRYPYMQGAWPSMEKSTAFNADLAYAIWRSCYEGYEWWLNDVDRGWDYAAGDAYGCMGRWFSGRWHTSAAEGYIERVKENYNSRFWETENFQEP